MGRLAAGGMVLVFVAAACAPGTQDVADAPPPTLTTTSLTSTTTTRPTTTTSTTTTPPPSGPGYGGVAIIADDQSPPTINPYAPGGDNFIVSIVGQAWLTGVWDIDGTTLDMIPEVVTKLPTVSNGGVVVNANGTMTVNYVIRDEAMWEDGTPISGYDFQFTLDTVKEAEKSQEYRSDYTNADIIRTEPGDKTFSMTLKRPTIQYEKLFHWLIPKHAVEGTDFTNDWNTTPWPSGGPFVIDTIEPNRRIVLVRNNNYWKTDATTGLQLPFLDKVEFQFIPEAEEIIRAFKAREVDVIQPPPSLEYTINPLTNLEDDGAVVDVRQGQVWEHINFQFGPGRLERSPNSCNDNLSFRRAVMHAIDRDAAAAEIYGDQSSPMDSYVDAFSPTLSNSAWARYTYDPELASELYAQAVKETGRNCAAVFSTTQNADMRPRLAAMYVEMFAEAGIPFELKLMDSQPFFGEVLTDGTWDIGQWAWVGSPGLSGLIGIHDIFDPQSPPPDGSNYYRWGTRDSSVQDEYTQRFAEIVKTMNMTVDDAALKSLIAEAEEILADQAVILPLFSRITVGAVWGDEIGGYVFNPSQASHTWNIEEWFRTDR